VHFVVHGHGKACAICSFSMCIVSTQLPYLNTNKNNSISNHEREVYLACVYEQWWQHLVMLSQAFQVALSHPGASPALYYWHLVACTVVSGVWKCSAACESGSLPLCLQDPVPLQHISSPSPPPLSVLHCLKKETYTHRKQFKYSGCYNKGQTLQYVI